MSSSIQCPRCHQTQTLQLVSSVYNSNTKEWVERDYYYDADGERHDTDEFHKAHTLLGEMVSPPLKPSPPSSPRTIFIIRLVLIIFLSTICISVCGVFAPLFIILGGTLFEQPETLSGLTTRINSFLATLPDWAGMAGLILAIVIGLTGLILVIMLVRSSKKRYDKNLSKYKEEMAVFERETMPNWEWAMDCWNKMYYCSLDNIVFIPDETDAIPVEHLKTFLDRYMHP